MKVRFTLSILASVAALALAGCASHHVDARATAQLEPTRGNTTSGTVTFAQTHDGVRVSGEIRGLKPDSEHGFHVHEKGDCSSGDGMSTGGHCNPTGKSHGNHGAGEHPTGDLPSLKADKYGVAAFSFTSNSISLTRATTEIIGKGLIVHRDPDDYKTQPTGNAGPRLACAVITAVK